jgi:ribosomal protein S17E
MENPNVLRDRALFTEKIKSILETIEHKERDYSDEERTVLMNRLEGYVIRLMRLPPSIDPAKVNEEKELCEKYESLVVADLEELKKSVKLLSAFLRRHRVRLRRQQVGAGNRQ